MDPITDILLKPECLYLMGATWVIMETLRRVLPEKVTASQAYTRLTPVLPLLLCIAGAWIPGILDPAMSVSSRILVGIILGYASGHMHKILMQTVLGKDQRLAALVAPSPPENNPAPIVPSAPQGPDKVGEK